MVSDKTQNTEKCNKRVLFKGKIIEVIEMNINGRNFEIARRSPGVRLIIRDANKILLSREYRHEHNTYDYRLPGGKVFDTLEEFNTNTEDIERCAVIAAKNECKQETGLIPISLELFAKSKAGSTIERDLYYFIIKNFTQNKNGQELENGEDITTEWKTLEETKEICLNGSMKEDRSVGILLKYLLTNK